MRVFAALSFTEVHPLVTAALLFLNNYNFGRKREAKCGRRGGGKEEELEPKVLDLLTFPKATGKQRSLLVPPEMRY